MLAGLSAEQRAHTVRALEACVAFALVSTLITIVYKVRAVAWQLAVLSPMPITPHATDGGAASSRNPSTLRQAVLRSPARLRLLPPPQRSRWIST